MTNLSHQSVGGGRRGKFGGATEASLHQPVFRVPGEAVSSSSPQTLFFFFTFPTSTPLWLPLFCFSGAYFSFFYFIFFLPRVFSAPFAWTNPLQENSKPCSRWTKTVPGGEKGGTEGRLGLHSGMGSDLTMLLCSFHCPSLSRYPPWGGVYPLRTPFCIGTLPRFPLHTPCLHPWKLWQVEPV